MFSNWQGTGPGRVISGPGSVTATELWNSVFGLAGARDAPASPATATSRANKRMEFSSLVTSRLEYEGELLPFD